MTDREKYLTILDRFYRGRGGSLLTKDECEAMEYAISSIKTDLKYDLLYEETNHIANVSKKIEPTPDDCETCIHNKGVLECDMYGCKYEPTTKTCRTCRNFGSHHGICEICKDNKCWTEKEPITKNDKEQKDITWIVGNNNVQIAVRNMPVDMMQKICAIIGNKQEVSTKNDLGVDCISRQEVLDLIADYDLSMGQVVRGIHALPSVTPQEPFINKPCVSGGVCEHDKNKVLDKLRAEIEQNAYPIVHGVNNHEKGMTLYGILQIIDKYKAEKEE